VVDDKSNERPDDVRARRAGDEHPGQEARQPHNPHPRPTPQKGSQSVVAKSHPLIQELAFTSRRGADTHLPTYRPVPDCTVRAADQILTLERDAARAVRATERVTISGCWFRSSLTSKPLEMMADPIKHDQIQDRHCRG
jgi:hypothetical protein